MVNQDKDKEIDNADELVLFSRWHFRVQTDARWRHWRTGDCSTSVWLHYPRRHFPVDPGQVGARSRRSQPGRAGARNTASWLDGEQLAGVVTWHMA